MRSLSRLYAGDSRRIAANGGSIGLSRQRVQSQNMQVHRILWAWPPPIRICRRRKWTLRKFVASITLRRRRGRGAATSHRKYPARSKHASTLVSEWT